MNKPLSILAVYIITAVSADESEPNIEEICRFVAPGTTILRPNTCEQWVRCPTAFGAADYDDGSCVYGLYFNKDTGRCESIENVNCPYESNIVKNRCASKKTGSFLPHPTNCKSYIYCQNGKEINATCPNNLIYHPTKVACVYAKQYECELKTFPANANPICKAIPKNKILADTKDCTKYYKCNKDQQLVKLECAEGQSFDYVSSKCVTQKSAICHPLAPELEPESDVCGNADNVHIGYIADEKSCSHYYICNKRANGRPDRKPLHLKCQNEHFFDINTWSCRDRLRVQCYLDRCEGIENGYVNVAGDCTAYAHCKNGVTIKRGKCGEGFNFDERLQICSQQNISYVACKS
ncbi:peritrophin-48-like [Eurosta solidaginis]|uniref:peritrophin-48-like n=1 Tax=Eurosta solidaginis TaxID=178769 RepID=UPI0035307043